MSDFSAYRIGRGTDVDIRIDDATVSRVHAELVVTAKGSYYLTDCVSRNGSYVARNGEWIRIRQEFISPADAILLGRYRTTALGLLQKLGARVDSDPGSPAADPKPADNLPEGNVRRNPDTGEIIPDEG